MARVRLNRPRLLLLGAAILVLAALGRLAWRYSGARLPAIAFPASTAPPTPPQPPPPPPSPRVPPAPPPPPQASCEPVHLAMMVAGANATRAAMTTLKSVLLHRTQPLVLHVMTDEGGRARLGTIFTTWGVGQLRVEFYAMAEFLRDVAWIPSLHESGIYGLSKLTYELALPGVAKVIALDTDVVIASDIGLLWARFATSLEPEPLAVVAAAPQQSGWYLNATGDRRVGAVWPAVGKGLNSGVLLLHLDRMRRTGWRTVWADLVRERLRVQPAVGLGDQDVFNLVATVHPRFFVELPCAWNLQIHDHSSSPDCYAARQRIHALHWNSPLKLAAPHPRRAFFAAAYARARATDGTLLREPPLACPGPGAAPPPQRRQRGPEPGDGDGCDEFRAAGRRVFGTHPGLYRFHARRELYSCDMEHVAGLPDHLQVEAMKVLARSHVLAQNRFLQFVEKQRTRVAHYGHALPRFPSVFCRRLPPQRSGMATSLDVTLVTHFSMERLGAFAQVLRHWGGPVSATAFAHDADLPALEALLVRERARAREHEFQLHLVTPEGRFYPVNYLRNVALAAVRTALVLPLDVDLVPSPGMYPELLAILHRHASAARRPRTALIVPAFETREYAFGFPASQAALKTMVDARRALPFRSEEWAQGHALTQYARWYSAKQVYPTEWAPGAEPYVVVAAAGLPAYDQRFVGFGWNKVAHIEELHARGYAFAVLPSVFLLHVPHAPSADLLMFRASPRYKRCLDLLHREARRALDARISGAEGGGLQQQDPGASSAIKAAAAEELQRAKRLALKRARRRLAH